MRPDGRRGCAHRHGVRRTMRSGAPRAAHHGPLQRLLGGSASAVLNNRYSAKGTRIRPTTTVTRTDLLKNADRELGAHRQRITDCRMPRPTPSKTYMVKPSGVSGSSNAMT